MQLSSKDTQSLFQFFISREDLWDSIKDIGQLSGEMYQAGQSTFILTRHRKNSSKRITLIKYCRKRANQQITEEMSL